MARRGKSLLGSIIFGAAAASAGYVAYRALKKDAPGSNSEKKTSVPAAKPRAAVKRKIEPPVPKISPASETISKDHLQWLPGLRAREQKILNSIPSGKPVKMSDIEGYFPHVTVRTLRRDLDRLAAKGRVKKEGTTRSTTYIKV